jgi:hypothetical protein
MTIEGSGEINAFSPHPDRSGLTSPRHDDTSASKSNVSIFTAPAPKSTPVTKSTAALGSGQDGVAAQHPGFC